MYFSVFQYYFALTFHTGHSVLGKTVGKGTEFKSNQSGTFPEAKQPCECPKKPPCTLQKQGTSPCSCLVHEGCSLCQQSHPWPWALWLGRQPGQQLVPIPPSWSMSAGDCQPDPPLAGSSSWESPKGEFLHNRSLLANLHRAAGKPSPPPLSSTPAQHSSC